MNISERTDVSSRVELRSHELVPRNVLGFDLVVRALVLCVWLIMVLIALNSWHDGSTEVPFSEDWLLVPAVTGHEPHLVTWLWAQHNEHRAPVPRSVLLILLKVSQGDFRAGGALNIVVLGAIALAMIEAARSLRGGKTRMADAFFPVAFLHFGHSENMLWTWQFTQVFPVALLSILMMIIVCGRFPRTMGSTIPAGICLLLLPLSGANGLLYGPLFALWAFYAAVTMVRGRSDAKMRDTWLGAYLSVTSFGTLLLTALYFVDYQHPSYGVQPPSPAGAMYGTLQFIALSFGPAARSSWLLSITAASVVMASAIIIGLAHVARHRAADGVRLVGIAICAINLLLSALAVGWSRAQVLSLWGGVWPIRYALFAVPILCLSYFVYELYGPPGIRTALQNILFAGMCLLIPLNASHGARWRDWYLQGAGPFEQDVRRGEPLNKVAENNREYLYRWMNTDFDKLRMLQESRVGIFAGMGKELHPSKVRKNDSHSDESRSIAPTTHLVKRQIRFIMPEAEEVYLVWGINGWGVLPEARRPPGTSIQNNVMRTPMQREGTTFSAEVALTSGVTADYCFLITKKRDSFDITWPLCEGDHHERFTRAGVKEITSRTSLSTVTHVIRYRAPEAKEVYLVWGLHGWHSAPEILRPAGTILMNKVMHTPMLQNDGTFSVAISLPTGTTLDYGFQITKRRGLFDIVYPLFDGNYATRVVENGRIDIEAKEGLFP